MEIVKDKIRADKRKILLKRLAGWPILIFFALAIAGMFIEYEPSELPAVIVSALFVLLALWLIISAGAAAALIGKVDYYADLIRLVPDGGVERIARAGGVPSDKARKDLREIIRKSYFEGLVYNWGRDAIVSLRPAQPESIGKMTRAFCSACGGTTEFYGTKGICSYCGSPLDAVKKSDPVIENW